MECLCPVVRCCGPRDNKGKWCSITAWAAGGSTGNRRPYTTHPLPDTLVLEGVLRCFVVNMSKSGTVLSQLAVAQLVVALLPVGPLMSNFAQQGKNIWIEVNVPHQLGESKPCGLKLKLKG